MATKQRYAQRYAELGWYVLPLAPTGKEPHGTLAPSGAKSASNDPSTINKWWTIAPDANIGIAAGVSGFHIIDIDVKQGDGIDEWAILCDEHGQAMPLTPYVKTPSGGYHFYFSRPDNPLPNCKLSDNIDTRGLNGYVVAPPSTTAEGAYVWERLPNEGAGFLPLPSWIADLLEAKAATIDNLEAIDTAVAPTPLVELVKRRGFLPSYTLPYLQSTSNKNEDDQRLVNALLSRGLTPEQTKSVFMAHPCGAGLKRKRRPEYYLDLTISRGLAHVKTINPYTIKGQPVEVASW
ncbi:MAG: bifunctional DNA primase/polymerase [Anaerolineales bacterium]|nr:bifunctional DNA primase/polymerase [Anaerolineales bacterium]